MQRRGLRRTCPVISRCEGAVLERHMSLDETRGSNIALLRIFRNMINVQLHFSGSAKWLAVSIPISVPASLRPSCFESSSSSQNIGMRENYFRYCFWNWFFNIVEFPKPSKPSRVRHTASSDMLQEWYLHFQSLRVRFYIFLLQASLRLVFSPFHDMFFLFFLVTNVQ